MASFYKNKGEFHDSENRQSCHTCKTYNETLAESTKAINAYKINKVLQKTSLVLCIKIYYRSLFHIFFISEIVSILRQLIKKFREKGKLVYGFYWFEKVYNGMHSSGRYWEKGASLMGIILYKTCMAEY